MISLFADLQISKFPRVAAYSLLAALVTTTLFGADAAYRWYRDAGIKIAVPAPATPKLEPKIEPKRSVKASDPAPVAPQSVSPLSPDFTKAPDREVAAIAEPVGTPPVNDPVPGLAGIPPMATAPASSLTSGSIPNPPAHSVARDIAPQQARSKPIQRSPRQQLLRAAPGQAAAIERAKKRRTVQAAKRPAAKPNVYFERDSQLGFAAQLRKRACNPATGNMPMQCYYPREGREKFPAKSVN